MKTSNSGRKGRTEEVFDSSGRICSRNQDGEMVFYGFLTLLGCMNGLVKSLKKEEKVSVTFLKKPKIFIVGGTEFKAVPLSDKKKSKFRAKFLGLKYKYIKGISSASKDGNEYDVVCSNYHFW